MQPAQLAAINAGSGLVSMLKSTVTFIATYKNSILGVIAVWTAYTAAIHAAAIKEAALTVVVKAKNLAIAAGNAIVATATAAYHLCAAGLQAMTGHAAAASASMKAFNAACAANPIGAVVTVILSLVAALVMVKDKTEEATAATRAAADATANAAAAREKETQELQRNIERLEKFNGTKEEEIRLVKEMNEKYGPMLGRYKSVADWLQTLKKRGKEYVDTVYSITLAEGKLEAARQLIAEAARKRAEGAAYSPSWWDTFNNLINSKHGIHGWNTTKENLKKDAQEYYDAQAKALEDQARELANEGAKERAAAEAKLNAYASATPDEPAPSGGGSGSGGGGSKGGGSSHSNAQSEAERAAAKAEAERLKKEAEELRRKKAEIEQDINKRILQENADFEQIEEKNLAASLKHEDALFEIKEDKYTRLLALYEEGSEQYEEVQRQQEMDAFNHKLAREKILYAEFTKLRDKYLDDLSPAERFKAEKAALDALLKEGGISQTQYDTTLASMKKTIGEGLGGGPSDREQRIATFQKQSEDLKAALEADLITQEEYNKRMKQLRDDFDADNPDKDKGFAALKNNKSEWTSQFVTVYESWDNLAKSIKEKKGNLLEDISAAVSATSAMVGTAMQLATEFTAAETNKQIAIVNKRYEKQLEAAQGNARATKNLEKKRDAEIAAIKAKGAAKQFTMQVIQTVAQTAANAVSAYGAALQTGPAGLILAPIAAAMAVAQGAVQIALLKKQQQAAAASGYMTGGFTRQGRRDEVAGVVHAGEWVAPQSLVNSPQARPLINLLEQARITNRMPVLSAADVSRTISPMADVATPSAAAIQVQEASVMATEKLSVSSDKIGDAAEKLLERLEKPIVAITTVTGNHGVRRALDEYDKLIANKSR